MIAALLALAIQQTDFTALAGAGNEAEHEGQSPDHGGNENHD